MTPPPAPPAPPLKRANILGRTPAGSEATVSRTTKKISTDSPSKEEFGAGTFNLDSNFTAALALQTRPSSPAPSSFRSEPIPLGSPTSRSVVSDVSKASYYSLPSRDPRGNAKHVYKRTTPSSSKELYPIPISPHRPLQTLMLEAGQGCTFACGDNFKTELGEHVGAKGSTRPAYASTKTKHLITFANNIRYIGTMECYTCLAVYFEISGNRLFTAHINAWHSPDTYEVSNLDLKRSPGTYWEIRKAVADRLKRHATEYGWRLKDVKLDTLKLACPQPEALGFAVPDAVVFDFLGLHRMHPIEKAHGFIIMPGARTKNGTPVGQLLKVNREAIDGITQTVLEAPPEELED